MIDLIVFSVDKNKYAISIDHIVRILQGSDLTEVPTSHEYIDGIMSYEDSIIKVLNFRKLINIKSYELKLEELFLSLKKSHQSWIDSLEDSLVNGVAFTKTLNPHMCELGKWIDSFTCYDDDISVLLNELTKYHKRLHLSGADVLEMYKNDPNKAIDYFNKEIKNIYKYTIKSLDSFMVNMDKVSNSIQKFLIYESNENIFAIKIDFIDDIAHVNDSDIMDSDEDGSSEFLDIQGVLDLDGVLINIIEDIRLPK